MRDVFNKLCGPAKLYFGLAVLGIVIALINGFASMQWIVVKLVWAMIWTYILCYMCKRGFDSLAWGLVCLPYILMVVGSVGIYHITEDQRNFLRMIKFQGAWGLEPMTNPQDEDAKKKSVAMGTA